MKQPANATIRVTKACVMFIFFLGAGLHTFQAKSSADTLVEGKCVISEEMTAFNKCVLLVDALSLSVLTGRNQGLLLKVALSEISYAGPIKPALQQSPPPVAQTMARSLSLINTSQGDAVRSSNVRAFQYSTNKGVRTLIFVADRHSKFSNLNTISIQPSPSSNQSSSNLAPNEARIILRDFERQLNRTYSLYDNLMFEEGDRVLDMAAAKANLFEQRYGEREGAKSVIAFLRSQIRQLESLRDYKSYDRYSEEREAERNYDSIQIQRAEAYRREQEYQYRMAVEHRKAAEANALRWYAFWAGRPATNILVFQ